MKKKLLIISLVFLSLFVVGCSKEDEAIDEKTPVANRGTILDDIDSSKSGKLACTREAYASEGIDVELTYDIEYNNGYISILHARDKVISNSKDSLDEYEDAYRKIAKNYDGLKYYDITITRDNNSVTNDILINYDKVDIDKLLDIEGEEDNVIVNGKVALKDWVTFAEQFGAVCREV